MATKTLPLPERVHPCERGLELKIQMADLEAEYNEIKPAIEAYCEANGGVYNSALGSYSTRVTPKYQYPATIELQRIELKQAEERARVDGSATIVNNTISVAASPLKTIRPKAPPIPMRQPDPQPEQKPYPVEDIIIPSVDESKPIPPGATCQEASSGFPNAYVPCGRPATAMVRHDKDRRSYFMCEPCAYHNIHNRGAKLVKTKEADPSPTPIRRRSERSER